MAFTQHTVTSVASKTAFTALYATADGKPSANKDLSSRARALILQGLNNTEVFTVLNAEYGLPKSKRTYPAWYRGKLTDAGLLSADLATRARDNGNSTVQEVTAVNTVVSLQETVTQHALLLDTLSLKIKEHSAEYTALTAAQSAFIKSVKGKPDMQTPLSARLAALQESLVALQAQHTDVQAVHAALQSALAAYNKALTA